MKILKNVTKRAQKYAKVYNKYANVRSHIEHLIKVLHAHRTHVSVRARVRFFFRNSQFAKYLQNLWEISANVNNYSILFATHLFWHKLLPWSDFGAELQTDTGNKL